MSKQHSDALVLFGATGDLAKKKLLPSVYRLIDRHGLKIPVIGVASSGIDQNAFRELARESMKAATPDALPRSIDAALEHLFYIDGDYRDAATFTRLRDALGDAAHPIHYLAIPPALFEVVVNALAESGCNNGSRLVVEKPFGRDLDSSRRLNSTLLAVFAERDVFRIDHFMGKEAVQNLLYFRFANAIIDSLWNRDHIESIQITMAESFGVESRGAFYDKVGTIRDVVQNHLLEILTLLLMEPPIDLGADAIRNEQVRVLRGIRPITRDRIARGQYAGYLDETGVSEGSQTETSVALRLDLTSWRWAGVPVLIRAGKHYPVTATEVVIRFRRPPQDLFAEPWGVGQNSVRFRVSPDVMTALSVRTKSSGDAFLGQDTEMITSHDDAHAMMAYERLLQDAIEGENALFARQDWVEAAWRIVDGILISTDAIEVYDPGTWASAREQQLADPIGGWVDPS